MTHPALGLAISFCLAEQLAHCQALRAALVLLHWQQGGELQQQRPSRRESASQLPMSCCAESSAALLLLLLSEMHWAGRRLGWGGQAAAG